MIRTLLHPLVVACLLFIGGPVAGPAQIADDPPAQSSVILPLAVRSLLIDLVQAGDTLVAVGERGHILRSSDQGGTWTQVNVPTRAMLTAIHAEGSDRLWTVGHDAVILHSEDAGISWTTQYRDPSLEMPLFDVWFADESRGIAVGAYGLCLVTDDGGATWEQQVVDEEEPHLFAIDQAGDGSLFLAGEFGAVFRSTDGGSSWERLEPGYEGTFFGVLALEDGSDLVFGLRGNVFRSTDAGANWDRIDVDTEAGLFAGVEQAGGRVYLAGQSGVILSSDDHGKSFSVGSRGSRDAIGALLPLPNGSLVLVGEAGVDILTSPLSGPSTSTMAGEESDAR